MDATQPQPAAPAPAVSVVLPTFNRLHYLREAVDSVLGQTFEDWELIIADDGSDPTTIAYLGEVAAHPRVSVLRLAHTGAPGAVRNAALRVARGEFVAFLDSDDIWLPNKLEVQVAALRRDRSCRWSYTAIRRIGPDGRLMPGEETRAWIPHQGSILEQLLTLEAAVATPGVVADRLLVQEAGGFDEGQLYFEEYDLWLRLNRLSDVAVMAEPLACVRNHEEHYTNDRVAVYQSRARLLDKVAGVATSTQLRTILRTEQARNAICLANAYAVTNLGSEALRTLWRNRQSIRRIWPWGWRKTSLTLARSLLPTWLYSLLRALKRSRRALALGRA